MRIGTRSVLFGAHQFLLHPFYVAAAWTKLYGFPWDPRLWVAFFVHDAGYVGRPNMDGPEGEKHVEFGAKLMHRWFDKGNYEILENKIVDVSPLVGFGRADIKQEGKSYLYETGQEIVPSKKWHDFCLYHSRHYAKQDGAKPSRLCFADKLAFCYQIKPLYLWMTKATGELEEYLRNAKYWNNGEYVQRVGQPDASQWYDDLVRWITKYVEYHKDGAEDKVTVDRRVSETIY